VNVGVRRRGDRKESTNRFASPASEAAKTSFWFWLREYASPRHKSVQEKSIFPNLNVVQRWGSYIFATQPSGQRDELNPHGSYPRA
jgi:hypothetical protein